MCLQLNVVAKLFLNVFLLGKWPDLLPLFSFPMHSRRPILCRPAFCVLLDSGTYCSYSTLCSVTIVHESSSQLPWFAAIVSEFRVHNNCVQQRNIARGKRQQAIASFDCLKNFCRSILQKHFCSTLQKHFVQSFKNFRTFSGHFLKNNDVLDTVKMFLVGGWCGLRTYCDVKSTNDMGVLLFSYFV